MIDNRASKRRLSDADKNERIAMRQMVLNMSMCKLQKKHGRKEPSLLRTVVINNTVQQIEREMDSEMLAEYERKSQYDDQMHMHVDKYFSPTSFEAEQSNVESISKDSQVTAFTFNDTEKFEEKQNRFGAIGDHRNKSVSMENHSQTQNGFLTGMMWDSLSLPSPFTNTAINPVLDSVEVGSNFTDVDISLYDFDNSYQIKDWQSFPRSCASEFDRRHPDPFFQELDQIMQVLVGM